MKHVRDTNSEPGLPVVYEAKTRRRPRALKKVKLLPWSSYWWNIGALCRVRWLSVAKIYVE